VVLLGVSLGSPWGLLGVSLGSSRFLRHGGLRQWGLRRWMGIKFTILNLDFFGEAERHVDDEERAESAEEIEDEIEEEFVKK